MVEIEESIDPELKVVLFKKKNVLTVFLLAASNNFRGIKGAPRLGGS